MFAGGTGASPLAAAPSPLHAAGEPPGSQRQRQTKRPLPRAIAGECSWEMAVCLFPAALGAALDVRGTNPDAWGTLWMATNRGHVFCRQPPPRGSGSSAADGGSGLGPLALAASGCPFGVSSHVVVALDTAAHRVGLSVTNSRPLSGPSALAQRAALGDAATNRQRVGGGGGESLLRHRSGRAAARGRGGADRDEAAAAAVDPTALGAASSLTPPHNLHHPFHLPAAAPAYFPVGQQQSGRRGTAAATAHARDAAAGGGSGALHACVLSLPLPSLLSPLVAAGRRGGGGGGGGPWAAVQLGVLVRDAESCAVTLLPPPLLPTRAMY